MTREEMLNHIKETVKAFYSAGGTIEINNGIPYVAIKQPNEEEYFFQGEEAENLLNEVPEDINEEEYIIWVSQGW